MIYYDLFKKVFLILNKDQKFFSLLILFLTFISILLETFGIATIFPLISSIVNENYFIMINCISVITLEGSLIIMKQKVALR